MGRAEKVIVKVRHLAMSMLVEHAQSHEDGLERSLPLQAVVGERTAKGMAERQLLRMEGSILTVSSTEEVVEVKAQGEL